MGTRVARGGLPTGGSLPSGEGQHAAVRSGAAAVQQQSDAPEGLAAVRTPSLRVLLLGIRLCRDPLSHTCVDCYPLTPSTALAVIPYLQQSSVAEAVICNALCSFGCLHALDKHFLRSL